MDGSALVMATIANTAANLAQTVVVAVANVLSTALRFVAMRRWIFAARP